MIISLIAPLWLLVIIYLLYRYNNQRNRINHVIQQTNKLHEQKNQKSKSKEGEG